MQTIRTIVRARLDSFFKLSKIKNFVFRSIQTEGGYLFRDFGDHSLVFDASEYVGRTLFDNGDFGRSVCSKIVELATKENDTRRDIFIEIGANIGTQTIYANLKHRFRRSIVVEPDPNNLKLLRANLRLNGFADTTTVCPCAVSDIPGTAQIVQHAFNSGATTIEPSRIEKMDEYARKNFDVVEVALIRADDLIEEHGVTASEVALVWIDVEGHEAAAMRGMSSILSERPPLYFEYSPEWMSDEDRLFIEEVIFSHYSRVWKQGDELSLIDREAFKRITKQTDILALA